MDETVEVLKKLGFRDYEARVYATLAMKGEATASEIHRMSGVPRNKVYEVLRSLEDKGMVETVKSSPAVFRAIDPESFLEEYKEQFVTAVDTAIRSIKESEDFSLLHPVWCVRGVAGIKNRAKAMLQKSDEVFVITSKRAYLDMILKTKNPEEITVVTDDVKKFSGLNVKILELKKEFSGIFNDAVIDGVCYRFELLLISGYESFGVYRAGDELLGVSINLPIIILFQKMIFLGLLAK
ncbi:MAG: TrmB family transcriptional regulator [Archaeoglobus sp.]|uniref:TrmB family transcriptional regulator n=1 Tax=Archaeoglobus sp. TaxID=1872626 RepID=UPI001DB2406F|nr:TrmB family transcriptional regulator [Archaeoglobus sp.]MBO8179763.1 TrmB family transcriptional regulator [Archaeoglobus sp.]